MSHLYFVRHAPTAADKGQIVGHHDVALSHAGASESIRFADALTALWTGPPPRIVSSNLSRAIATAAPLADRWNVAPATDERLREVDFGSWEGRTWADVEQSDGDALSAWMADWVETHPPGGESFADLHIRASDWLAEQTSGEPLLIVAHAGSIRALLCAALKLPLASAFSFDIAHLRMGRLDMGAMGGWTLRLLGAWPSAEVVSPQDRT